MIIYYSIVFFIFGTVLGSFYNVVGDRLPRGESLISPGSHCSNCGHELKALELIPIFSYIFLGGKCKKCHHKISIIHPLFELLCGLLFLISFIIFGFTLKFIIALTFVSILLIVIVSDYEYMIICDEVLIIGSVLLILESFFYKGIQFMFISILYGLISFGIMWLIKILGDFFFKRESMGGGDIKLMFVFGLVLGLPNSLLSIFLASLIGLPISLIFLYKNKEHEIPFGPYLSIAALILFFTNFNYLALLGV